MPKGTHGPSYFSVFFSGIRKGPLFLNVMGERGFEKSCDGRGRVSSAQYGGKKVDGSVLPEHFD